MRKSIRLLIVIGTFLFSTSVLAVTVPYLKISGDETVEQKRLYN